MKQTGQRPVDPPLAEAVGRIVESIDPQRVYLLGSQTSGEATTDRDYDLHLVVRKLDEPAHRVSERARELIVGLGVVAEILVWEHDAFDRHLNVETSLPATVVREGMLIYAG